MRIPYFPGCTLYSRAKNLDDSTRAALAVLGVELAELPQWTCCGVTFPLAQDNYIGLVASARILANAAKAGDGRLVTVCSFCYNVLKRVNYAIKNNPEAKEKLNNYLEENYQGETSVVHPLEVIRNEVGLKNLANKTGGRLKGLKVACYYGCMLVRPAAEVAFGDPENPVLMEELVAALGAEPVDFPWKTKCCGSYQLLNASDLVADRVRDIVDAALAGGARAIVTNCPLCQFNLDWGQKKLVPQNNGRPKIPVLYFTQLLGAALELPTEKLGFRQHYVDPWPLLSGGGSKEN